MGMNDTKTSTIDIGNDIYSVLDRIEIPMFLFQNTGFSLEPTCCSSLH